MDSSLKPHIVISGVNLTDMGPLAVLKEALESLAAGYGCSHRITALVHRASLFSTEGISYLEFPSVKSSWLRRLHFEYLDCKRLSKELKPDIWISMHDMTPNVHAKCQVVYCHNPSIFHPFRLREARLDPRFGVFTLFYPFLYSLNIKRNRFVIVQQRWMREAFVQRYGLEENRVVVAYPETKLIKMPPNVHRGESNRFRYFYPAFPRVFKNFEVVLEAARLLERQGFDQFELWLTTDSRTNAYSAKLVESYADVKSVRWLGLLTREQVFSKYAEADCLLFPSKLETWGMPLTEFKATGKPIMAVDLAYAHETIGEYGRVAFFGPDDPVNLGELMRRAALGLEVFSNTSASQVEPLFAQTWKQLWEILLAEVV